MKQPWKIDVPVLLIFFARPETFEKVFESVREARPSTLLLWQDGPREGRADDMENIMRCREIVENIDWECTVYKKYNEKNYGCDPSTFYSHKWAFSLVDKCIILEDDRVPSQSFYPYCKYLLDKYEFDERINHICGANLLDIYEPCSSDYFFAPCGSTTWATWKRVADGWDEEYLALNDDYSWDCLESIYGKTWCNLWKTNATRHKNSGRAHWETILGIDAHMNSRLVIIPKKNMVTDIGMTENATHAIANAKCLPKVQRNMFNMTAYEVSFPLKEPSHIVEDMNYMNKLTRISGVGRPWLRFWWQIVYIFNCIRFGQFREIFSAIKRKLKRMLKRGK